MIPENNQPLIYSCSLNTQAQRERAQALRKGIFSQVTALEELPDGFAFVFNAPADFVLQLVEFIHFERICCPYFTFNLLFAPQQGPVTLQIYGSALIKAELKGALPALVDPALLT